MFTLSIQSTVVPTKTCSVTGAEMYNNWSFRTREFSSGVSVKSTNTSVGISSNIYTVETPNKGLWNKGQSPLFDPKSRNDK